MIEIQELYQKSRNDIVDLLLDQQQPFKIYIPKNTKLFLSSEESIALDYAKLAYSGQLLSGCADSFDYEQVQLHGHESVLFQIQTDDIKSLANRLFKISFGYANDSEDDFFNGRTFEFDEYANQFLYEVKEGKTEPVCEYFYETYLEFRN